ncbi:MAG: hypothetical protein ACTS42_02050 [Candidatus Hodgkinia cicadicola]
MPSPYVRPILSHWLTCPSEYERGLLRERVARLSSGVAVIKSEVWLKRKQ